MYRQYHQAKCCETQKQDQMRCPIKDVEGKETTFWYMWFVWFMWYMVHGTWARSLFAQASLVPSSQLTVNQISPKQLNIKAIIWQTVKYISYSPLLEHYPRCLPPNPLSCRCLFCSILCRAAKGLSNRAEQNVCIYFECMCMCVVFTKLGLAEAAASKQKTTTNRIEEEHKRTRDGI